MARERRSERGIDMTREGCQARRFATETSMTMASTTQGDNNKDINDNNKIIEHLARQSAATGSNKIVF